MQGKQLNERNHPGRPNRQSQNRRQQEIVFWSRLIRDQRWSITQKHVLLGRFGSPAGLYQLPREQIAALSGKRANKVTDKSLSEQPDADLQWLEHPHHHLITLADPRYPALLGELEDAPLALYASGDLTLLEQPKIAIVGSRRPSPGGSKLTQQLAAGLAGLGIIVTSGMALGIDAIAHQAALQCTQPTIAVMGCGLDIIYPARHAALFHRIAEYGLLLSEYPIGYPPTKYSFPQRNRIVSGLCYGTIIMEAAAHSGTAITARLSMEQNREVMVVPGSPLNPLYTGSNQLIQQGAALVTSVEDVLQVVSIPLQSALRKICDPDPPKPSSKLQSVLLEHIGFDSTTLDQIILASGLTAAKVSSMLVLLELEGVVAVNNEGGYVRLC